MKGSLRWSEEQFREDAAKRSRWQRGSEIVNTESKSGGVESRHATDPKAERYTRGQVPASISRPDAVLGGSLTARDKAARAGVAPGPLTSTPAAPVHPLSARAVTSLAAAPAGTYTIPWPPTGNSAVRHARGIHYLRPEVIAYRDAVAGLLARAAPITGRYRLHVHLSPPDARRRDADNALKSILDACVKAGYLVDDSLTYMHELLVTTDEKRLGHVRIHARPA